MRPAATYSPNAELGVSTIGPDRLNCRVRNGNGCFPVGNTTGLIRLSIALRKPGQRTKRQPEVVAKGSQRTPPEDYTLFREKSDATSSRFPPPDGGMNAIKEYGQASRTISTASLKPSRVLHSRPIKPVVFWCPLGPACAGQGNLILRRVSRLDAFSVYPFRTPLPSATSGEIAGIQEVRPARSSRTMASSPQVSLRAW